MHEKRRHQMTCFMVGDHGFFPVVHFNFIFDAKLNPLNGFRNLFIRNDFFLTPYGDQRSFLDNIFNISRRFSDCFPRQMSHINGSFMLHFTQVIFKKFLAAVQARARDINFPVKTARTKKGWIKRIFSRVGGADDNHIFCAGV